MNDRWKLRVGLEAYRQFVHRLLASQASNGPMDAPILPYEDVSREAMVERFLASHPDLKPFQRELIGEFSELSSFCVNSARWNEAVPVSQPS
jgi:hypothetical protein